MLSYTEENYLKALLHITYENGDKKDAGTNEIAAYLNIKPATVNDMLKKLKEKKLIDYEKYGKSSLTTSGKKLAVEVVRKHRLWETFLYEKLEFTWDEVHEVAEQMEHINHKNLIERLDKFLGFPDYDPHGDPIPKSNGQLPNAVKTLLSDIEVGKTCRVAAVKDTSTIFLQYLLQLSVSIGTEIKILDKITFDGSMKIQIGKDTKTIVSIKFAESLLVDEIL